MKIQRCLPPAAAPVSVSDVLSGVTGMISSRRGIIGRLEAEVKAYFGVKHAFFISSGKAALTTILLGLQTGSNRRKVIIPAYTCFSVPSSVLKAGLDVVLCDVDPFTLDYNFSELEQIVDEHTLAIVSTHLLGQPADVVKARSIGTLHGAYVIEDAAQAMGGKCQGRWLGTQGDIGFFSLGRGKNLSAGGGGIIITNSDRVAGAVTKVYEVLPQESYRSRLKDLLAVASTLLFLRPRMYWFPTGFPFLKLGETIFCPDFPVCRMEEIRAGVLRSWRSRLEQSNKYRQRMAYNFYRRLSLLCKNQQPKWTPETTYLRFPLLMTDSRQKAKLCQSSNDQGLGISALYPCPIHEIPELKDRFGARRYPGAKMLSETLVTLPIHQYVVQSDIDRIASVVESLHAESEKTSPSRLPISVRQ